MKHFKVAHHAVAASSVAAIAISLGLAATSFGQAVVQTMLNSNDQNQPVNPSQLYTDTITNIVAAQKTIEQVFVAFREDNGVTEAKDIDHVIATLVDKGYLELASPAVDMIMTKGLDAAFGKLDTLANAAIDRVTWARDSIETDGTDSYLRYTTPAQDAVDDMTSFVRDLQLVISATWRDHNQQPSLIATDMMSSAAEANQLVTA